MPYCIDYILSESLVAIVTIYNNVSKHFIMLTPINTTVVPRDQWNVELPGAGPRIKSMHFKDFLFQVSRRLQANGLDRHDWREWVLDEMCKQNPSIECEDKEAPKREVTGEDVWRFVRTLYAAWEKGAEKVSAEEQNRRADICLSCPKRGYVSCNSCGSLAQALSDLVMGTGCERLPELHKQSCMVCGCELSSLVQYPLDVIQEIDRKLEFQAEPYPSHCWKLSPAHDDGI